MLLDDFFFVISFIVYKSNEDYMTALNLVIFLKIMLKELSFT